MRITAETSKVAGSIALTKTSAGTTRISVVFCEDPELIRGSRVRGEVALPQAYSSKIGYLSGRSPAWNMPMPPTEDVTSAPDGGNNNTATGIELHVRRMHRRDINRVWQFLKMVFRDVNRETVEFQRPRHKKRFVETYEDEGVEQLLFEISRGEKFELVGYAEYSHEIGGTDSWMNHRYFEKRGMRPLFVEEIAVHPDYHGLGIGSFMFEQIEHAARLRGCTHIVLEVAENNEEALRFYRKRGFHKLDAAIFLSRKLETAGDLLSPRMLKQRDRNK